MEYIHEEKRHGLNIKIYNNDDTCHNPREWDNLGTMLCWHRKYELGDKNALNEFSSTKAVSFKKLPEYCDMLEIKEILIKEFNAVIVLPLYLYDHGDISIETVPHGADIQWDCGFVGFIYITKEKLCKEFSVKRISQKLLKQAEETLILEVKTYNDYLTGNIYGYHIEDDNGEIVENVGGYFGDYNDEKYGALKEARDVVDARTNKGKTDKDGQRLMEFVQN